MISVIVASGKKDVSVLSTVESCPVDCQIAISREQGLSRARNSGAHRAIHDILLFLDDDIAFNTSVWDIVRSIRRGEFAMSAGNPYPTTRILSIHKDDFQLVGGFDERIRVTGEDRDFFFRAIDLGLRWIEIPMSLVYHEAHEPRENNIHTAARGIYENVLVTLRHTGRHPDLLKREIRDLLWGHHPRTIVLTMLAVLRLAPSLYRGKIRAPVRYAS